MTSSSVLIALWLVSPAKTAGRSSSAPDKISLKPVDRPDSSGISTAKAQKILGYTPKRSWKDYLDQNGRAKTE